MTEAGKNSDGVRPIDLSISLIVVYRSIEGGRSRCSRLRLSAAAALIINTGGKRRNPNTNTRCQKKRARPRRVSTTVGEKTKKKRAEGRNEKWQAIDRENRVGRSFTLLDGPSIIYETAVVVPHFLHSVEEHVQQLPQNPNPRLPFFPSSVSHPSYRPRKDKTTKKPQSRYVA